MTPLLRTLAIASLVIASLAGCGSSDDDSTTTTSTTAAATTATILSGKVNEHGTAAATAALTIELDDNYFSPTYLEATAGQQMNITLKNDGQMFHTFTSTALNVDVQLKAGETKNVTVTAPATPGTTEFWCTPHKGFGMRGAIIVK